jgi:hypothetical protein
MIRSTVTEYLSTIKNGPVPQPCSSTCQATCIYAVTGARTPIGTIRQNLLDHGVAGDPGNMRRYLVEQYGNRYEYDSRASINSMKQWIGEGDVLIVHGWFTRAGHVIVLDGCDDRSFHVMDPWSQFNASTWVYDLPDMGFLGKYSDTMIYAAVVAGHSADDAHRIYNDRAIDRSECGAWCHRIKK